MTWSAHRIDGTQNLRRWDIIWTTKDLFGDWECWTAWGRIGRRPKRQVLRAYGCQAEVEAAAERLKHRKVRRGYRDVVGQQASHFTS